MIKSPLDKKQYARLAQLRWQAKKGKSLTENAKEFVEMCRKKYEDAGLPWKPLVGAPSVSSDVPPTPPPFPEGEPPPKVTAAEAEAKTAPPQPKTEKRGKRPPLEPPIPPEQIAKLATAMLVKIELDNRAAGYGVLPDFMFPVWEAALTDLLQDMAKKGYDLRKIRGVVVGVPAAAVVVQGVRRKVAQQKKLSAAAAKTVVVPVPTSVKTNGVADDKDKDDMKDLGSVVREDEV